MGGLYVSIGVLDSFDGFTAKRLIMSDFFGILCVVSVWLVWFSVL